MNTHSTLVLANREVIDIPYISEAGAGWILKPEQARTEHDIQRGLNKSFGRSHEGRDTSRRWRREYLQAQFDRADWSPLESHDYDVSENTPGGAGITFSVLDTVHGWNVFRFFVHEPSYRETDYRIRISWEGTAIQQWYLNREVDDAHPYAWKELYVANYSFKDTEKKKVYTMAAEFAADPMGYVQKATGSTLPWHFDEIPELDWGTLSPISHFIDDAQTFHLEVDKAHVFWRKGDQAKATFVKATAEIEMLEKAFKHLGIEVRIGTGVNWDISHGDEGYRQNELRSVDFIIPADAQDPHNAQGHQVTLSLNGIKIACGYVTDDQRWEQRKARQAAEWLTDFEKESTQTYEDYDYKPN